MTLRCVSRSLYLFNSISQLLNLTLRLSRSASVMWNLHRPLSVNSATSMKEFSVFAAHL